MNKIHLIKRLRDLTVTPVKTVRTIQNQETGRFEIELVDDPTNVKIISLLDAKLFVEACMEVGVLNYLEAEASKLKHLIDSRGPKP